jgi:hypothetical protein
MYILEFDADKPVRSAIVIGQRAGGWSAYFGDSEPMSMQWTR